MSSIMSGRAPHRDTPTRRGCIWSILLALCLPTAAVARAPSFPVARDGVGPVHKDTKLEDASLKKLFKGCKLKSVTKKLEKKPIERDIDVFCGAHHTLTLRSENDLKVLASVEVLVPGTKSPAGVGVGDTLGDLYKLGRVDCDAGIDPPTRRVQCIVVGESAFAYAGKDNTDTTAGMLPPEDKLKLIKITGVVWRAGLL
jgi:hypothetical protein